MKLPKPLKNVMKNFEKQSDMLKLGIVLLVLYGVYRFFQEMQWGIGSSSYLEGFTNKTFVFFRMNGCGHCDDMKPEWNKFTSSYGDDGPVELKEVEKDDMTTQQQTWVKGFPTLVLVENGKVLKTYEGERTAAGFKSFLG